MTEPGQSSRLDLDDGRTVVVRALVPSDEGSLRRAFEQADPTVLRSRFGGATPRFSQIAERLRNLDGRTRYAAGAFDDEGNVVGVAEYVQSQPDGPAEVAIIVARVWQRQGVGAALLQAAAARAVRSGIRTATALISGSNAQVRELIEALPVQPTIRYENGAGTLVVDMDGLARPAPVRSPSG